MDNLYVLFIIFTLTIFTDTINITVIVPMDDRRLFSFHHVAPAIDVAIDDAKQRLLRHVQIAVHYGDSKCNSKDAPLTAFDFYRRNLVNVFIAPISSYSLAPVARYSPHWNLPVISPGGFAHDFGANKSHPDAEYSTLTRVGVTFNSLALTLIDIAKNYYKWRRIKVIYEGEGHSDVTPRFCFLAASALVHYSKEYRLEYDFHIFIRNIHDAASMLRHEIGVEYSDVKWTYGVQEKITSSFGKWISCPDYIDRHEQILFTIYKYV